MLGASPAAPAQSVVDDLRMLVSRLARSLRLAKPDIAHSDEALDYLKRQGLAGSPLREAAPQSSQPAQSAVAQDDERAARQFKEALHDHFNEFPIPTQLGVVAIMKHIEHVYAELARA